MIPHQEPASGPPRTIRDAQWRRLRGLSERCRPGTADPADLEALVTEVSAILDAKVALARRHEGRWQVLAEAPQEPAFNPGSDAWASLEQILSSEAGIDLVVNETGCWTVLRADDSRPTLVAIQGDWTTDSGRLRQLVGAFVASARQVPGLVRRSPRVVAHRLTHALGRASSVPEVCEALLRHVVRVVPSRLAAVAVPVSAHANELMIAATHGYPREIVEDVRIPAGSGVIGTVFERRAPLCVEDISMLGGSRRRPRYQTNSFLAVPIKAGSDVLGVVCMTDRLDGGAFTRDDLSKVRAVAAPAALALGRERQRAEAARFAQAAIIDPLSGLFNRRYFQERLAAELHRAQRHQTSVALLMIDVDDFKEINDRLGHTAGDTVIVEVSEIIRRSVRMFDICSRFGGEEFAVLMPGTGRDSALNIAERIRQRISLYRPRERALHGLRVTASIGLAVAAGISPRELIDAADAALYQAKRAGKNRVEG